MLQVSSPYISHHNFGPPSDPFGNHFTRITASCIILQLTLRSSQSYFLVDHGQVLLRAFAAGSAYEYLWACKPWAWNWLDLFVVVSSWTEMMVDFASGDSRAANTNLRIMRIMRIGRLARVVRVVRVVRLFRALRTLVASLVGNRSQTIRHELYGTYRCRNQNLSWNIYSVTQQAQPTHSAVSYFVCASVVLFC